LGWGQLLATVFTPDASTHNNYPSVNDIGILYRGEDPLRLASILTRYSLDRDESIEQLVEHLTPLLQNRLYKSTGWQRGLLAHNIAGLALSAATLGKTVHVVTTNYDTLLESSFQREILRTCKVSEAPDTVGSVPGVTAVVYGEGDEPGVAREVTRMSEQEDGNCVTLHYLHGRVPPSGTARGKLVISEVDYAETRQTTVERLRSLFQEDSAIVILGASLTDPPLIDALALTAPKNIKYPESTRHVLIPCESLGYQAEPAETHNRMVGHLARRCELLGITLLAPDFRFQGSTT
jgi:hypothetical protein